jgi:hypothetical protein
MIPYQPMSMQDFVGQPEEEPSDDVWAQAMSPDLGMLQQQVDPREAIRQKAVKYGLKINLTPEESQAIQQALVDTLTEDTARNKKYQERENGDDQQTGSI